MASSTRVAPEAAHSIAQEAYTYEFPMVESYKTL